MIGRVVPRGSLGPVRRGSGGGGSRGGYGVSGLASLVRGSRCRSTGNSQQRRWYRENTYSRRVCAAPGGGFARILVQIGEDFAKNAKRHPPRWTRRLLIAQDAGAIYSRTPVCGTNNWFYGGGRRSGGGYWAQKVRDFWTGWDCENYLPILRSAVSKTEIIIRRHITGTHADK